MATRTSFELHPDGCRLVEVQVSTGRDSSAGDIHVRKFVSEVVDAENPSALSAALQQARQDRNLQRASWVTVWGLRSTQLLLRLPPARPGDLEALATREARKDIAPFDTDGEGASLAVVPGADVQVGPHRRREVSLVVVSSAEVRARIQPIVDAGFEIAGVVTPALALAALARTRAGGIPGSTSAYVALSRQATCLAIVRDGVLVFTREMPWGHASKMAGETLAVRLAMELKRSILYFKQTFRTPVVSVVMCGDMRTLRTLTAPLGDALGVPVETLDSLVGIDAASVPEPAEMFRADVSALWLAIATGADAAPSANLLPMAIRNTRDARTETVRVAVAVAVGLLLTSGWYYVTAQTASNRRTEVAALEQQLALLEPESARMEELRAAYAITTSRRDALTAFDSQGPRLARFLEAASHAAPDAVALRSITADAYGAHWRVVVRGIALSEDAAAGQAAVDAFLTRMSDSPFAGPPAEPPSLRVVSGSAGNDAQPAALPAGTSGVEFTVQFMVAK